MLFSPFWSSVAAISLVVGTGSPIPKLIQEGDSSLLHSVARLTSGLRFSHGAFVCTDSASARFFIIGRDGNLIATSKLEWPKDAEYHISDFDRFKDGSIVSAALPSLDLTVSPFLAFLSPDGKTKNIIRTGAYFPYHVVIASDGTVWTLGYEMVNGTTNDPALDPKAGILRQFSRSGSPMASALPQGDLTNRNDFYRIHSGRFFAVRDRLGWYSAVGGQGKYVEIPTDRIIQNVFPGLPATLPDGRSVGQVDGAAATVAGDVVLTASYADHRGRLVFFFDRLALKWIPIKAPSVGAYPSAPRLLGAEGEDLLFEHGSTASAFRLAR